MCLNRYIVQREYGNEIDPADYLDVASDVGNDYWFPEVGVYSKNRQTQRMKLNLIIDTDCDSDGADELLRYNNNSIARLTDDGKRPGVSDLKVYDENHAHKCLGHRLLSHCISL